MYKGKVYEPENDITNVMANIISEFLSTAYKTDDKKEKKDWVEFNTEYSQAAQSSQADLTPR